MENFSAEKFLQVFFRILYDDQAKIEIAKRGDKLEGKSEEAGRAAG